MIIHNLNLKGTAGMPHETDTVLIVDPNAVLPRPVSAQGLEPVSRWRPKVVELDGRIQNGELLKRPAF